MELIIRAAVGFAGLLEDLYIFFFSPVTESLNRLLFNFIGFESPFLIGLVERLFSPGGLLENVTVFEFLLGGGILVFLLIRLLTFLLPIVE